MSRMKNDQPSIRVRLDGYVRQPVIDERMRKALDWLAEMNGKRKAFPVAWGFVVAAVNGELGPQVQAAVADGNTEEALDALHDLLGAFGGNDD